METVTKVQLNFGTSAIECVFAIRSQDNEQGIKDCKGTKGSF